jgi:nicotinamidase-related amidase
VDVINHMDFPGSRALVAQAVPMARRLAKLKARAKAAGIPCIYCNDNFGQWRSDFRTLVAHSMGADVPGREVATLLQPDEDDYFVLKPRHSAFFATPLELLLRDLGATTLMIAGIASNICVLFSANDAYIRGYDVVVVSDCVAANTREQTRAALAQMRDVLRADVRPSSSLRFTTKARARRRPSAR